jgi:hypothetical protein
VDEKGLTGRKQLRTRPLSSWEKFRDKLKVLKILYDRDD